MVGLGRNLQGLGGGEIIKYKNTSKKYIFLVFCAVPELSIKQLLCINKLNVLLLPSPQICT
jgi:hypothetical protein